MATSKTRDSATRALEAAEALVRAPGKCGYAALREAKDRLMATRAMVSRDAAHQLPRLHAAIRDIDRALETTEAPPEERAGSGTAGLFLDMIVARFESDIAEGRLKPARAAFLRRQLADLRKLVQSAEGQDDVGSILQVLGELSRQFEAMRELKGASYQGPPPRPGTRGAQLEEYLDDLQVYVQSEISAPDLPAGDRQALQRLLVRLGEAGSDLRKLNTGPEALLDAEANILRSATAEVQRFAMRHHIMLMRPLSLGARRAARMNSVFFSGSPRVRSMVEREASARGCEIAASPPGADVSGARFDQLMSSAVAIFDLTVPAGLPRAEVCYELGIARALGRPVIVACVESRDVPFNIDLQPVADGDPAATEPAIGKALDRATYGLPRRHAGSSLAGTVRALRALFEPAPSVEVKFLLGELERVSGDPTLVRGSIEQLLGRAGPDAPIMAFPAWPGAYPDAAKCFHVTPFMPEWASETSKTVKSACEAEGLAYKRGDMSDDPNVIRGIWDDLCTATHVVVDITGFNQNVMIELGISHALGRRTLVLAQEGTERSLGNGVLAKVRVTRYRMENRRDLEHSLREFLRRSK